jgi:hypothetical protein
MGSHRKIRQLWSILGITKLNKHGDDLSLSKYGSIL